MVRLNGQLGGRGGTGQGEVRAAHSFAWGGRGPEPEPCQSHVAGRGESQHPFHIHFPGGRNRTSILHPFFSRGPKPNVHFTSIFPGGRNPVQHPFYIHFPWENGCKMDVGWRLENGCRVPAPFKNGCKMDVRFRPSGQTMDVKWMCGSGPLENGCETDVGIHRMALTWL